VDTEPGCYPAYYAAVAGALAAQPASREDLDEIRRMLDTFEKKKGSR